MIANDRDDGRDDRDDAMMGDDDVEDGGTEGRRDGHALRLCGSQAPRGFLGFRRFAAAAGAAPATRASSDATASL